MSEVLMWAWALPCVFIRGALIGYDDDDFSWGARWLASMAWPLLVIWWIWDYYATGGPHE